jgi:hypothetical protein
LDEVGRDKVKEEEIESKQQTGIKKEEKMRTRFALTQGRMQ